MKSLTKKILFMVPILFFGSQVIDNRIPSLETGNKTNQIPLELIMLKQSIQQYSSKIELLQSEIELKLFYQEQPYKVLKQK